MLGIETLYPTVSNDVIDQRRLVGSQPGPFCRGAANGAIVFDANIDVFEGIVFKKSVGRRATDTDLGDVLKVAVPNHELVMPVRGRFVEVEAV
ncbi:hypothetical protein D9M72_402550 [compost metagenome]